MGKELEINGISKMLTLSTAHIKEDTAKMLDHLAENNEARIVTGLIVYPKSKYGWFIPLCDEQMQFVVSENLTNDNDAPAIKGFPEDLKRCLEYAASKECAWLCLERDGVELSDELPTYNW